MNDTDANVIQRLMIMRTERAVLQEELNLTRQVRSPCSCAVSTPVSSHQVLDPPIFLCTRDFNVLSYLGLD